MRLALLAVVWLSSAALAFAAPTGGPAKPSKPSIINAARCGTVTGCVSPANALQTQTANRGLVNVFSTRKAIPNYSGPLFRLYRSSDGKIQDFYPVSRLVGSTVSSSQVNAWLNGSSASVLIWYDQSGNGNHATAPFADLSPSVGLQPAFLLNCVNSMPCVSFNGANAMQANSPVNGATAQYILTVNAPASHMSNPFVNWAFCCGQSTLQAWANDTYSASPTNSSNVRVYQQDGVWGANAGLFTSTSIDAVTNGVRVATQSATSTAVNYPFRNNLSLGFQTFGSYYTGKVAEVMIGTGVMSVAQAQSIQADQMAFWGIGAFPSFSFYNPTLNQSTSAANSPPWYGINQGGIGFGTAFDAPPSATLQSYYVGKGFNITRLPVAWEQMQQGLCTGVTTLDATELAVLDAAVTAVTSAGMDILIDLHNYGKYTYTYNGRTCASPPDNGNIDQTVTRGYFVNFWSQIATRYKTNPKVKFDLMNEPVNVSAANLGVAAQLAITAIRAAGATQPIFVEGGGDFAACQSFSTGAGPVFKTLTDTSNSLIAECHAYFDSNNSGTSDIGLSGSAVSRLSAAGTYAAANGIKLFLGEFGVGFTASMYAEDKAALDLLAASPSTWVGWTAWGGGVAWPEQYIYLFEPRASPTIIDRPMIRILNTYATGHVWPTGKFP